MLSLLLVFLMGLILPFAFAPFAVYTLALICPSVLLYQWLKSTPKMAFVKGGLFGLGYFGVGISWVYISIHTYGNASVFVAGLITFTLVALLALCLATQGYVLMRLFGNRHPLVICLAAFPATWVLWEWFRTLPLNGFPWLYLGYSQLTTPLRGFAPVIGVFGVSLAVTAVCGSLVIITTRQTLRTKIYALIVLAAVMATGWLLTGKNWTKPAAPPLTVSLVQANISQSIKWQAGAFEHIAQTYQKLSQPLWGKSRLIIWPEAALPAFPEQIPGLLNELNQTAVKQNATLLLGILLGNYSEKRYFNGIMLLGVDQGEYRKRHLVPFGEYTPLKSVFSFLINYWQIPMSDFTEGANQQKMLTVAGFSFTPFICYEIAYPLQVLKYSENSEFIVNISDDSWFGKSMASAQQAEMARMRALEIGRFILLGANTGITAIIDAHGEVVSALPAHQQAVLSGSIIPMQGQTPLMHWNYWPLLILIILLLGIASFSFYKP
jgi:apolipoprotein N-acyltransferase